MESLSRTFRWGQGKLESLQSLLNQVPWVDLNDPGLLEAYGRIDYASNSAGRTMGKNDVWIAAASHVTHLTLLTTDKDFDHLQGPFLDRIWIDPNAATHA